jgi:hypothetical protein
MFFWIIAPVHKIPSIHHGQKYEAKARRCYAKEHLKTCGCNVSVRDMGLYISLKYHFLGASVDGIITCSKCESYCVIVHG